MNDSRGQSSGASGRGASGQGRGRPTSGRPAAGGRGASRGGESGRGAGGSGSRGAGGDSRGRSARGDVRGRGDGRSAPRDGGYDRSARTEDQRRYDGPDLPEDITGQELDRNVAAQLTGLPEKLAARVARHLAAAGSLLDSDPELAYQHALAAKSRASRVAVIREAVGETAYLAGHYSEALAELKAAKRMNGAHDYLPLIADCERALGRPERAIELAKSQGFDALSIDQQVEVRIVEAGARFDLGDTESALRTLENARVKSAAREPWLPRLRYAYADLLLKAGRETEALEWFHRTVAVDGEQITDAAERVAELEKLQK